MASPDNSILRIPVATYRLQFSRRFTLSDGLRIASYLADLGITEVYASPCFEAGKGSAHGYDVVNPGRINPELGGHKAFDRYVAELHRLGMGLILDIVPNHMNVESDRNSWWMDVLENGPASLYANFFDIDWAPARRQLQNRVLIPILSEPYGAVLEGGELRLIFKGGGFFLQYYDHILPMLPETYPAILTYRVGEVKTQLGRDHPGLSALMSIVTALECLPAYTGREQEKMFERHREKEIIKKRLNALYRKNPPIRDFINHNLLVMNGNKGDPGSFNLLDDLLDRQVWRLSYWRVAAEEINYRRFFDINGLAAIRMENPAVFRKTHALTLRLVREGKVTGLRVDHPDGLYDPSGYFRELQRNCFLEARLGAAGRQDPQGTVDENLLRGEIQAEYEDAFLSDPRFKPFYIVGEKILSGDEQVPEDWPVFSTIGYVFLDPLNGIFVKTANSGVFSGIYRRFTGSKTNYRDLVYEKKKLIMLTSMSGEINRLARHLNEVSGKNRHTRDFTLNSLRAAITEVMACFPVYRTYTNFSGVKERDVRYIGEAVSEAKRRNPALSASTFEFLERVLLLAYPPYMEESDRTEWVDFVMKFQQTTGPVTAKGVEDTAFYIYNRLMSLNEVGGNPEKFGTALDAFHRQNIETAKQRPYSLVTTSTHDTKRSEDARARLNVLSEIPGEWRRHLASWNRLNKKEKRRVAGMTVPDRNEEYLFYQTLIAVWPADGKKGAGDGALKARIQDYMLKAVREAKINSSWINPDIPYERALLQFTDSVLSAPVSGPFLQDFLAFQDEVAYMGMFKSLSQSLLKITSPGVPDFYQGCELWDLSLVDPDNRRPVDFGARGRLLKRLNRRIASTGDNRSRLLKDLLRTWRTGAVKLFLIATALNYRKENRALFEKGEYIPVDSGGSLGDNVCASARRLEDKAVLTVAPRFLAPVIERTGKPPLGRRAWKDSWIIVPDEISSDLFRNVLTNETVGTKAREGSRVLALGEVFASLPAALLEGTATP